MKKLILLLTLSFLVLTLSAQEVSRRPKVGIALSGGGAKGFSHIGVLKVLEEAGIVPDYITGTSMGSVVGGLYALGYPADLLEKIAIEQDWTKVLTDDLALQEVIFEEKLFFKNQQLELPIQDGGIKPPGGLIQGQEIEHLLTKLTLPAFNIHDFDDLPIPFHCMAVDLFWGEPVEFSEGSLFEAIRASMAIPSVFTPVYKDTLILIDGGVIRNFPVQEVADMGADIVIGVHCGKRNVKREELEGLTGILSQALFLGSIQDSERQMEYVDLYIEPDIDPYGAPDFAAVDSIIARGEAEARRMFPQLKALADSLNELGPPTVRRPLVYPKMIRIDRIEVIGNDKITENEIIGRSEIIEGTEVSPEALDQAVNNLFGTNYFTKINYGLREENGEMILVFYCVEKAPALIKAALTYDSYHNVGLAFNLTFRNLLGPASRLMLVGKIATNYRYRLSYLKYLGPKKDWFLEGLVQFNRDRIPSIQEGQTIQEYRLQDAPVELTVNRRIGKNLLLSLGGEWEFLSLKPTVSENPPFQNLKLNNFNFLARVQLNSLNRNILPTRGVALNAEFKFVNNTSSRIIGPNPEFPGIDSLFMTDSYPKITVLADAFVPAGEKSSLRLSPFAGLTWNSLSLLNEYYLIGAPERLSRRSIPFTGFDANEFVVQVAIGAGMGFQYFLWDNLMVSADLNGGFFAESTFGGSGLTTPDEFLAGAGFTVGYSNTVIGPVKLSIMHPINTGGLVQNKLKIFLSIGHRF